MSEPTALYRKVKSHIQESIESGACAPGDRVPSESELVRALGVSRMTANRALRELAAEGWLTRIQGVGTFVAEAPVHSEIFQIRNIADEIEERGHRHRSDLRELGEVPANQAVAKSFGIVTGASVFHSLIVHSENDVPIQIEDRYVNPAIAPDYLSVDFTRMTPNEYLVKIAPIGHVRQIVEAVMPDKRARGLLRIGAGEPCLRLFRLTWSGGVPGTCAWLTHPGGLYRMVAQFVQPRGAAARPTLVETKAAVARLG
jgi:GntR family transcriptional regulator, histidine utilization repressor